MFSRQREGSLLSQISSIGNDIQIGKLSDIGALREMFKSQPTSQGSLQCGASMMRTFQTAHTRIASNSIELGDNAQKADVEFAYLADYLNNVNSSCQKLHKQVKLVPHLEESVGTLHKNIVYLCDKMDRLEMVLKMVQARKHARRVRAWEQHSERETKLQNRQQRLEYKSTKLRFRQEEEAMSRRAKALAVQRKKEEDALKERMLQAEFDHAVNEFRRNEEDTLTSDKLRHIATRSYVDTRTDEEKLQAFQIPPETKLLNDTKAMEQFVPPVQVEQQELDSFYDDDEDDDDHLADRDQPKDGVEEGGEQGEMEMDAVDQIDYVQDISDDDDVDLP